MPMKARYEVINGEVIAEKRGGVRRLLVPDPLGSTVALLDNTQAKTDTFGYWPYGEQQNRTGTTGTPFQYGGSLGYYHDSNTRNYVRARELSKAHGRWMTADPLAYRSEDKNLYRYAFGTPITYADRTGLRVTLQDPEDPLEQVIFWMCKYFEVQLEIIKCAVNPILSPFCKFSCSPCPNTSHGSPKVKCKRACKRRKGKTGLPCFMLACVVAEVKCLWMSFPFKDCLCICPGGATGPPQHFFPPDF
jgi:RHS repeat-associated protein